MAEHRDRATLRHVADAAGVSMGTVSHALNGTGRVAEFTRARVVRAATQLGYRPDPLARALRSRRTSTIGLILPQASGLQRSGEFVGADFYLELATASAQAALARDHGLLLLPSPSAPADLQRFALDGVVLSDPEDADPRLDMLDALGIPVVTLERDRARPERRWWIAGDTQGDARILLDHLATAGARSIALFTASLAWSWFADIETAYRDWVAHVGMRPRVVAVPIGACDAVVSAAAQEMLEPGDVDAVLAPPERLALAASVAAERLGFAVPQDVRIAAAVDGGDVRAAGITALDLRPRAHAEAAVDLLLDRLAGSPACDRQLRAQLRARGSTGR